jgi:hypothetical protein
MKYCAQGRGGADKSTRQYYNCGTSQNLPKYTHTALSLSVKLSFRGHLTFPRYVPPVSGEIPSSDDEGLVARAILTPLPIIKNLLFPN